MDIENSLQTDYEADKIFDLMDELKDSKLPSNIDPETRTVEEIDSEARDTYFEELGDDLYEERLEQIDEYQSMSEDEKTSFFEEIGYSKDEAAKLVAAPAAGQTAYVYGKLNQSLTAVSNKIAANEGITNFVSGYTDNNTMTNITNKVANADLTPVSGNVQDARQQLTVAKDNYDNSVNKANKAVDKAADAKNKYNNVQLLTNFCEFKTPDKYGQRWTAAVKWGGITEDFNQTYQQDNNSNFSYECQFRCELYFYEVLDDRYEFLKEINMRLISASDEEDKNYVEIDSQTYNRPSK